MCQKCDANEEHPVRECPDAASFLYGDPSARRVINETWRAQAAVEELIARSRFD